MNKIAIFSLAVLLLSACSPSYDVKRLITKAIEYGWTCRDRNIDLETCIKDVQ